MADLAGRHGGIVSVGVYGVNVAIAESRAETSPRSFVAPVAVG
jgi:hypothetical protein